MRALPVLFGLAIIGGIVAYIVISAQRTEIPQRKRLCALRGGVQKVSFTVPKGSHFNLLIGTGRTDGRTESNIVGTIGMKVGTNVIAETPFNTATLTPANWLSSVGLDAFILTQSLGQAVDIGRYFSHGAVITIEIKCERDPVGDAALWLSYLVKAADRSGM